MPRNFTVVSTLALLGALVGSSYGAGAWGRLGRTVTPAILYASPNTRSHAYFRAPASQSLAVRNTTRQAWLEVLLENGTTGYVLRDKVQILPYEVTLRGPVQQSAPNIEGSLQSRGSMANYALKFVGTPYVWGGNDPERGVDCSGFVKQMYGAIGIKLPRTAAEQAMVGTPITRMEDLIKGDRLYFCDAKRTRISHTGIYLGNGYFVHSSRGHRGVATDILSAKWQRILVAARR